MPRFTGGIPKNCGKTQLKYFLAKHFPGWCAVGFYFLSEYVVILLISLSSALLVFCWCICTLWSCYHNRRFPMTKHVKSFNSTARCGLGDADKQVSSHQVSPAAPVFGGSGQEHPCWRTPGAFILLASHPSASRRLQRRTEVQEAGCGARKIRPSTHFPAAILLSHA